ncbi:MAG: class I SAM-dependent methyltransferase [Bdellovibrionales bacterium]|nr:class I SAM-dependent methyltransferase [Bdellovibrionales bacterium]
MRSFQIVKRVKQVMAVLSQPSSLASINDLPWNNVLHAAAKPLFTDSKVMISFEDLCERLGLPDQVTCKPLLRGDLTPGGVSPRELTILCHLAGHLQPKRLLEVGTFRGRTTLNFANVLPNSEIRTFNWPQELCSFPVGEHFRGTAFESKIIQVWGDTRTYDFSQIPKIDMAFIDADHSYEMVHVDSAKVFSRLNDDGIIVWHDVDRNHLGSTRAVMEFCNSKQLPFHIIEDSTLAIASRRLAKS